MWIKTSTNNHLNKCNLNLHKFLSLYLYRIYFYELWKNWKFFPIESILKSKLNSNYNYSEISVDFIDFKTKVNYKIIW